jgi:hypothetical protein
MGHLPDLPAALLLLRSMRGQKFPQRREQFRAASCLAPDPTT